MVYGINIPLHSTSNIFSFAVLLLFPAIYKNNFKIFSQGGWREVTIQVFLGEPLFASRGFRPAFAENHPRVNVDKEPSEKLRSSRKNVVLKLRKIQHLQDVQQLKEEKEMNITYHEENGYLIPNVVVGGDAARPIDKYGRMRNRYLQEYHPVLFEIMVMNGTLFHHLIETEEAAQTRLEAMIPALARDAGATESLKAADQMKWVGFLNSCKAQAEKIVFTEIIYT